MKLKILNAHKLQNTTCCELSFQINKWKTHENRSSASQNPLMQSSVRNFNNRMIFHLSSIRKATKSALMPDKKLCKHNLMISPQARYISKIHKLQQTPELIDRTTRNTAINLWLNHNPMNKIHKTMTHLGKNDYTQIRAPKA